MFISEPEGAVSVFPAGSGAGVAAAGVGGGVPGLSGPVCRGGGGEEAGLAAAHAAAQRQDRRLHLARGGVRVLS